MELATRLQNEVDELRAQIIQKEEVFAQQCATIDDLRETISNQRNDIRSAMELVVRRPTAFAPHSPQASQGACLRPCDPSTEPVIRNSARAPSPSNMHTHYHWHQKHNEKPQEDQVCDGASRSPICCLESQRCQLNRLNMQDHSNMSSDRMKQRLSPIKLEMDKMDQEVADLDAALKAAAVRFS